MLIASLGTLFATACLQPYEPAETAKAEKAPVTKTIPAKPRAQPAPAMPGKNVPAIKVDTVGYPATWRKLAIFNVQPTRPVVLAEQGQIVYEIPTTSVIQRSLDPASGDPVWHVEFTPFDQVGRYRLADGDVKSDFFTIGPDGYQRALIAAQKQFYFQRSRTALVRPYAEWEGDAYLRERPSHVHEDVGWDLLDYPEKRRKWKVEGGWHDAGNYDMYVPSTAPTAQALLMAFEEKPEMFADNDLNIPESGNGVPDILDEVKWGLTWVLSVQEKESGAFRHREAVMEWTPEMPADQDRTARWVAGPSTAATAKAVAALAVAARVFEQYDEAFSKRCAEAAKKGWDFLEAHPQQIRVDGKGSKQPEWDDEPGRNDTGARFTASAEMWRTFRDEGALATVRAGMDAPEAQPSEFIKGAWANLSRWALTTLARDQETPNDIRGSAQQRLIAAALSLRQQIEQVDGYRCASRPEDYYWGHNSNLMEKAHILLVAAELTGEHWPRDAARDQWHWMLGRNPNGYSMVTRVGKGPTRIYHMEWGSYEPPPPGYLVGGPNAVQMKMLSPEAPAKAILWDNPEPLRSGLPAHALWHWKQSDLWDGGFLPEGDWTNGWWAVTEGDIYYNANLVLVAAHMQEKAPQPSPPPRTAALGTPEPSAGSLQPARPAKP